MTELTKNDWAAYMGVENFKDGSEPKIHHFGNGFDLVAERTGVYLIGNVATRELEYKLAGDDQDDRENIIGKAKEWVRELNALDTYQMVNLMHILGIESIL